MTYCKPSEPATITYSFAGNKKQFVTDKTPIDIATYEKRINTSPNFKAEGYTINFYSPNNRRTLENIVRDHIITYYPAYVTESGFSVPASYSISWIDCGAFDFIRNTNGTLGGVEIDPNTLIYKPEIKCPGPPLGNKCSIEVKHKGIIIFQDQGNCPVSFSIQCGDCPEGTIKCNAPGYPGYCCLPCTEIAGEIKAIASQVRRINNV
ncbi:hypothetical protein [Chroococcidiopsis sp.]|uniref:hypothetical protein n=1 Tax=Chroococcidiopsis sp. TaxID=3088168 RepID=UPI003F3BB950